VSIDPGRLAHRDVASYVDVHPLGRQADADAALSALRHWWADSVRGSEERMDKLKRAERGTL